LQASDRYIIRINFDKNCYEIVNRHTEIVEAEAQVYPRALALAVAFTRLATEAEESLHEQDLAISGKIIYNMTEIDASKLN
jgi:hypothetical protein